MKQPPNYLLLLAFLIGLLLPSHSASASETRLQYRIEVDLDYASRSLAAVETVRYTNRTPDALTSLVFKAVPAFYGGFELLSAQVDGQTADAKLEGTVLELTLHAPLGPGETVEASIDFRLRVPAQGGRYGYSEGIMAMGNWFPILAVYREPRLTVEGQPPGWDREQYVEMGDAFFSEASDFHVTVSSNDPSVVIAHTGEEVTRQDGRWSFRAMAVRDFAMAISNRYQTTSRSVGDITVTTFTLPEQTAAGRLYLEMAGGILGWLEERLAPYPWKTLRIAQVGGMSTGLVGQEYPGLIFISSTVAPDGGPGSFLSYLVFHEVAHQWFYGIVGNDQVHQAWLDEAMATWLAYRYIATQDPQSYARLWQTRIVQSVQRMGPSCAAIPLDSDLAAFPDDGCYFAAVYSQGAIFMQELYERLGDAGFFLALSQYQSLLAGELGAQGAFLKTLQAYSSQDLAPVAGRYLRSVPDLRAMRPPAVWPPDAQPGKMKLRLSPDLPVRAVEATLDGVPVEIQMEEDAAMLDTTSWPEGPGLLRLAFVDALGLRVEESQVVTRQKLPTPAATPTPAPDSSVQQEAQAPSQAAEADDGLRERALGALLAVAVGAALLATLAPAVNRRQTR